MPLNTDISHVDALGINPIQATFKGGKDEILHLWYPLLEGYSPEFVEAIITSFAPSAERILDPFGGTGTTPITVSQMGRQAFYSEVNPLMQYLIQVKTQVYNLDFQRRHDLLDKLHQLIQSWPHLLEKAKPDRDLDNVYSLVFGKSQFFDKHTYDLVLRARSVIDDLAATGRLATDILTIAVLASLLPSSEMIRSGDIRYRIEKERDRKTSFVEEVGRRLQFMVVDVSQIEQAFENMPVFVCEDARAIGKLPNLDLDLVVTSPPYLNGTNYFRNSKIELWFLRVLRTKQDLADYRYRAVTSGINDVTNGKVKDDVPAAVASVLKEVEANAYDGRIPKMVLGYFQDMQRIFRGIVGHLREGATIAIDLGDSIYAKVHIPTDRILVEILREQGIGFEQEVVLRKRISRDQTELRQVLLVLRYEGLAKRKISTQSSGEAFWSKGWSDFKINLPHQKAPYSKRNWGSPLHSLCSYHGKMKPSLAHHLVRIFVTPGGKMLDPFAGVGTIPFEGASLNVTTYGFDISPAAVSIASAKLGTPDARESVKLINTLEKYLSTETPTDDEYQVVEEMGFNGRIPDYYHPRTLREVLLSRRYFMLNPASTPTENLVFASLLHILHGNRPYALSRRSHPITPYKPTGESEYRALIPRLQDKVDRSLNVERPAEFVDGKIFFQDATRWWPKEVEDLDAVITSPPFFDSTRFHIGNWMRLWFCGWEKGDFNEKPLAFIDELQKESFSIYSPIFRQARERLKPGGVVVLHLGLSHKSDMATELAEIASPWFDVADTFVEDVTHLERHGIRDKGTVTGHQFLVLK